MNREHAPACAQIIAKLAAARAKRDVAGEDDFATLEHSLAHRKGVTDPNALAAAIGRKKLGSAEMARRSAAGRK